MAPLADRVIPKTFQDVLCSKCQQHLTDPRNAVTAHDMETGGMKGHHIKCPQPEPEKQPAQPVQFTTDHEQLLLVIGRTMHAMAAGNSPSTQAVFMDLTRALAPFEQPATQNGVAKT